MTSRWVVEVAPQRDVPVRWRAFSLAFKNEGVDMPEKYRAISAASLRALRVMEAARAVGGDEVVGRLYTEVGRRAHLEDDRSDAALAAAVEASGLDASLAAAADDQQYDAALRSSMAEAAGLVGNDVGVPILAFTEGDVVRATFGPVVSPSPTGAVALRLWDNVTALAFTDGFYELKRSRTAPPQLTG